MLPSKGKLVVFTFSLLIIFFVNACNPSANASSPGTYAVDQSFSDFYRETGGISVLGPAISPGFEKDGITYQYIVSGLMAYDPSKEALERFLFSPIASVEWNINDLAEPEPSDPNLPYINGHQIWEEVFSFYTRYGPNIIGFPVTSVKANDEKQRYEQYFEGVGFFRNYSDPPGQVQLLPYGSWMCGNNCQYHGSDVIPPPASYSREYSETEQIFLQESERLGYGFSGEPLTSPDLATDGYFEMVFENVVMYIDPSAGNQIKLRPLPTWIGIQPDELNIEIKADWLSFYQVKDGLGYNVPNSFVDYIAKHGGIAYSGLPITEYKLTLDGGYSQCFTNICLEYHPTAPEQLRIRPHALGIGYQRNGLNMTVPDSSFTDALQINVWEQYPLIPSGQRQIINVEVLKNDAPVAGIEFSVVVLQPDGITKSYQMLPTGEDGRTSVELDPINGPNGAIVQYKVCVIGAVTPQICFSRSYTIWNQ
jgi:hypothetical protein